MMPEHHAGDLLAAYVLDAVTADEAVLVEEHLVSCSACRLQEAELRSLTASLPALATELPPPPRLKARLMSIVEAEARAGAATLPATPSVSETPPRVIPLDRARQGAARAGEVPRRAERAGWPAVFARLVSRERTWLPLAAMVALVLVLICLGVWRPWAGQPARPTTEVALAGTAVQPAIRGQLRYFKQGNRLELDLRGLRPLRADQVYELWLIRGHYRLVKGVGTFRAESNGTSHLSARSDDPADYTLACLTVERAPGATRPTLPLVAFGAITG